MAPERKHVKWEDEQKILKCLHIYWQLLNPFHTCKTRLATNVNQMCVDVCEPCIEIIVSGQFCKQNTNIDKWSLHIQTRLVKVKIGVPFQHFIKMFGETICISFKLHLLRTRMCSAGSKMVIIICKECESGIQKWQLFMWPCYIHSFNIDTCFEKNMEYEKNLDIQ